jgi:hypothetical protein
VLEAGETGRQKIHSVFSLVRMWGGQVALAYAVQCVVTVMLAPCSASSCTAPHKRRPARALASIPTFRKLTKNFHALQAFPTILFAVPSARRKPLLLPQRNALERRSARAALRSQSPP